MFQVDSDDGCRAGPQVLTPRDLYPKSKSLHLPALACACPTAAETCGALPCLGPRTRDSQPTLQKKKHGGQSRGNRGRRAGKRVPASGHGVGEYPRGQCPLNHRWGSLPPDKDSWWPAFRKQDMQQHQVVRSALLCNTVVLWHHSPTVTVTFPFATMPLSSSSSAKRPPV